MCNGRLLPQSGKKDLYNQTMAADSDSVNLGSNPSSPARVKSLLHKTFSEWGRLVEGLFHVARVAKKFPFVLNGSHSLPDTPRNMDAT
jgi:hypothetical protein